MTAQRTGRVQWKATTVLIRTDIFERAQEAKTDISSICNRALAERLGIDCRQERIPVEDSVKPVIIAKEPAVPREGPSATHVRPVLNAEDPATPVHLKKMLKERVPRRITAAPPEQAATTVSEHTEPEAAPQQHRAAGQAPPKDLKKPQQKKGKDDRIRTFLSRKILRTEPAEGTADRIVKDEMYQAFLRWCRAKPGSAVPDKRAFSIALKNRFVLEEIVIDGIPYWNNVRLR